MAKELDWKRTKHEGMRNIRGIRNEGGRKDQEEEEKE